MRFLFILALVPSILAFSSCSTTPQDRIEKNPAAYQQLTQEQQVKVSYGRLSRGMSPEAVRLAWGDPDDVVQGGQGGKVVERWLYTNGGYSFSLGVGGGPAWASRHSVSAVGAGVSIPLGGEAPRARAVVTFVNGRVEAWEGEP